MAERGTIYTSKQTSASDVYKFEKDNLYISWQVKYGVTKPFGKAKWEEEVTKAILHNCTDANTNIKLVLVITAQKLASFFTTLETSDNCEVITDGDKRLAVQFNPGYVMQISHKTWTSEYTVPNGVQVVVLFNDGLIELLGKPIFNFMQPTENVLDTAVMCCQDLPLPDPIFTPIITENEDDKEMDDLSENGDEDKDEDCMDSDDD